MHSPPGSIGKGKFTSKHLNTRREPHTGPDRSLQPFPKREHRAILRQAAAIHFEAFPASFERVDALSRQLDQRYATCVSPLVRMWVTPKTAHWMEQLHPMRSRRMAWSDQVAPMLSLVPWLAQNLKASGAEDLRRETNPG